MEPLIGHADPTAEWSAAVAGGQLHHAWLLAGPAGVGKAHFARLAALRLLAEAAGQTSLSPGLDVAAESTAAKLFAAGTHPDYRELRRLPKDADKSDELTRSITIAQVRELIGGLANKPALSSRRVIVIDSVDDLERPGASNALLKSLEEPPAGTVFLLVSHAPGRLLPTIRSRCRTIRFGPLSDTEVDAVLARVLPDADASERAALAGAGEGAPGRAIHYAGLDVAALDRSLAAVMERGDPDNGERLKLGRALAGKAAQARYELFLDRAPTLIARAARDRQGEALRTALDAHAAARDLAGAALGLSLDPAATVFEMAGIVARLASRARAG